MKRILSDLNILKPEFGEMIKKMLIVNITFIMFTQLINIVPTEGQVVDMKIMYFTVLIGVNVAALISAIVLYLTVWKPQIDAAYKRLYAEAKYPFINKRFKQR